MDNNELAGRIIDLRIASRLACMCEEGDKALLSLRTKVLYVLSKQERMNPQEIMSALKILKPNLTILAKDLESEGLIIRTQTLFDRRTISYQITGKGTHYLEERLKRISKSVAGIFDTEKEYDQTVQDIDKVLNFLSFLAIGD